MAKVKIHFIKVTKYVLSSMPYYIRKALYGISYYYIKVLYWKYTKFLRVRSWGDTNTL